MVTLQASEEDRLPSWVGFTRSETFSSPPSKCAGIALVGGKGAKGQLWAELLQNILLLFLIIAAYFKSQPDVTKGVVSEKETAQGKQPH